MTQPDLAAPLALHSPTQRRASVRRRHTGRGRWRLLFSDAAGLVGGIILLVLLACALFADQLAPFAPTDGDLSSARVPPAWHDRGTWAHPLGTDQLGQDILSRIIYGSRVSLTVGFFGAGLATLIGVTLGLAAGYFGGWLDWIITSLVNVMLSLPYLVLVIVIAAVFGRSLLNVVLIFGVTTSPVFMRVTRGEMLRLKQTEYVQAARSLGATPLHLIGRHMLPNLIGSIITLATFEMSAMIIYESGLSFLGLSVPPEVPSWGNMLSLGRQLLPVYPWIALFPGLAVTLTSLGINLLGDRVRDVLDPRLQERT